MAALKQYMDMKKFIELLHLRFGHMSMDTGKAVSTKLDVGVKINAKGLTPYECVAWPASKMQRMSHPRVPLRKSEPLNTLMMDTCTVNEQTADGVAMFLFIIDEATRNNGRIC